MRKFGPGGSISAIEKAAGSSEPDLNRWFIKIPNFLRLLDEKLQNSNFDVFRICANFDFFTFERFLYFATRLIVFSRRFYTRKPIQTMVSSLGPHGLNRLSSVKSSVEDDETNGEA